MYSEDGTQHMTILNQNRVSIHLLIQIDHKSEELKAEQSSSNELTPKKTEVNHLELIHPVVKEVTFYFSIINKM